MKEDIKQKWITALESGEYKQGKDRLKSNKGFCCLGVLCDIHSEMTGEGNWVDEKVDNEEKLDGVQYYKTSNGESSALLPDVVKDWAGLDSNSPRYKVGNELKHLATINDRGTPFKSIANIIREEF
jgi:hypothetical protein